MINIERTWFVNPALTGQKEVALARMKTWSVSLISTLPVLNLEGLELNFLPPEIGELQELTGLILKGNKLTSLPAQIGQLTQLQDLNLEGNLLETLPQEIRNLKHLVTLNLADNQFASLPSAIGHLISLKELKLDKNKLISLPGEMRWLQNLHTLSLEENSDLAAVPIDLGQIPKLSDVSIRNTKIDPIKLKSILEECEMRENFILMFHWQEWAGITNHDLSFGFNSLKEELRKTLREWLYGLERTQDFQNVSSKTNIAKFICDMLPDVFRNEEFQELFFAAAAYNLASCKDTYAMSLNEIFTSWKVICGTGGLQLMTACAKVICLRKRISQIIGRHKESASVYLFNEVLLKNEGMDLLTIAEDYEHPYTLPPIPNLREYVENHYFDELFELPIFEKMLPESIIKQMEDSADYDRWKEDKKSRAYEWYLQKIK